MKKRRTFHKEYNQSARTRIFIAWKNISAEVWLIFYFKLFLDDDDIIHEHFIFCVIAVFKRSADIGSEGKFAEFAGHAIVEYNIMDVHRVAN